MPLTMTIPTIRAEMRAINDRINHHLQALADDNRRLAFLELELRRRPARQRAPQSSRSMSDEVRFDIEVYHQVDPAASHMEIAEACGVNPGRVSEVLNGKRGEFSA